MAVIGFWGILVPVVMAFPEAAIESVVAISAALAGGVAVLWKFMPGSDLPSAVYSWVLNRKPKDDDELQGYQPLTKRTKRLKTSPTAPPTVEDVRGIKESTNNWVPTGKQSPLRIVRSRRLGANDSPTESRGDGQ